MNAGRARRPPDAVVVGAGPNGLAAAITLAEKGLAVLVLEAEPTIGGGARSARRTLPGFVHDVCSAIHPLAVASPLFQSLPLTRYGLEWIHPPAPLAHPLDREPAVLLEPTVTETAAGLAGDAGAYERLVAPLVASAEDLFTDLLGTRRLPRHPWVMARFGLRAARSARGLASAAFDTPRARALLAGLAAHSTLPLEQAPSAAIGLVLAVAAHAAGWPMPRGGAQRIADAMAAYLRSLGGEIGTGTRVGSLEELPDARAVLLDLGPRQFSRLAGPRLPRGYREALARYRYGPAAFKIDWALDGPIPWNDPACARAGTVHLGGSFEEIAAAERAVWQGQPPERPFVILAQPSLFDPSRAPAGKHTAWAYCHVPHGSSFEMTARIEAQVERFASGFARRILARRVSFPADLERSNENNVGGDISGGVHDFRQLLARPVARWVPYRTPLRDVYLGSSSTPPGAGVHGMCGRWAAQAALRYSF